MNKRKISAKIIADSIDGRGNRITSYILTYPRIIHAELLTHRMFTRNAASSRAIPFAKMVKDIQDDPFIPIAWQKDHKGMQGSEYFTEEDDKQLLCSGKYYSTLDKLNERWLTSRDNAIQFATDLNNIGVTKQVCNRLLEPFQWYTCLVTATEYDNFFELRCPNYFYKENIYFKSRKDWNNELFKITSDGITPPKNDLEWLHINSSQAEIHIQALAEAMWDAKNESIPKKLKGGEWHIPFGDKIDPAKLPYWEELVPNVDNIDKAIIKIATARCARLSYMTFDGDIDYDKDIKLHDQLLKSKHFSPFEHCARCLSDEEYYDSYKGSLGKNDPDFRGWCDNFKGFIQYRRLV